MIIYTIGHSAHEISEFIAFLKSFKIQILADVRSIPGSRYAPQYNEENLEKSLKDSGIEYLRLPKLGGRRKSSRLEDYALVAGWKNKSFKNYAAYALNDEYEEGIAELISLAEKNAVCIMCAESVPWRCHRSLIANTLVTRGIEVGHIMGEDKIIDHEFSMYGADGIVQNDKIIYPAQDASPER